MVRWLPALCAAAVILSGERAHAQMLRMGSPAPRLEVRGFLKGSPLKSLEKGKIHVIEFWATWCGPCIDVIPHLTELQKKHPQVNFIGVNIWEDAPQDVKPFVARMGSKMDYRVAIDLIPAGKSANAGKMSLSWMKAAGKSKIPTAFIVDAEGRIAWIGHGAAIDEPLAKILAGRWNIQAEAAAMLRNESPEEKAARITTEVAAAQEKGDYRQVLALVQKHLKAEPRMEPVLALHRFRALYALKDPSVTSYARKLVDQTYKDHARGLDALAWAMVDPKAAKPSGALAKLALEAAKRADTLSGLRDPSVADTVARAYFVNGDARRALEVQQRSIHLSKGTVIEKQPFFKAMQARLEQYRKAAR